MQMQTAIPRKIMPMLAASAAPFDNPGYLFETKWDGVRGMLAKSDGHLRIWGREGQDYTPRYPELSVQLDLPDGTVLDGELVLLRNGRPDFHALMAGTDGHRAASRTSPSRFITSYLTSCTWPASRCWPGRWWNAGRGSEKFCPRATC